MVQNGQGFIYTNFVLPFGEWNLSYNGTMESLQWYCVLLFTNFKKYLKLSNNFSVVLTPISDVGYSFKFTLLDDDKA